MTSVCRLQFSERKIEPGKCEPVHTCQLAGLLSDVRWGISGAQYVGAAGTRYFEPDGVCFSDGAFSSTSRPPGHSAPRQPRRAGALHSRARNHFASLTKHSRNEALPNLESTKRGQASCNSFLICFGTIRAAPIWPLLPMRSDRYDRCRCVLNVCQHRGLFRSRMQRLPRELDLALGLVVGRDCEMRTLIFVAILLATTIAGLYPLVSSSVASVRNARAPTFSERFAPVLDQMKKPTGAITAAG
jgi:hypothetical protein